MNSGRWRILTIGILIAAGGAWFIVDTLRRKERTERLLLVWSDRLSELDEPYDLTTVLKIGHRVAKQKPIDSEIRDAFGTPVHIVVSEYHVELRSAGVDRKFGTWDDLSSAVQVSLPSSDGAAQDGQSLTH